MADAGQVVRRIYGNLGRLLGGKAGAGVISLAYLAIGARALGRDDYGVLILVHTYVMTVAGIIEFPGWHAVVRYGATRRRPGSVAVDGVSLDVAAGEIVALLGPSGCGKSSLLRAVAGLEPLAGGSVAFDGEDLAGVPVHRRGFGLLFQDGQLFPHRDVGRNVAYGLEAQGVPRAERAARVAELLADVGLAGYAGRSVATLSGGEKQRVALARALAPRPRLLLLDEPLSALDRRLRERLAVDVRDTLKATGTTAVFVTHDHDEAFTVADRVAVMDAGRLLQVAAPDVLLRAPAGPRVAEFLGLAPGADELVRTDREQVGLRDEDGVGTTAG